jgi:hypothetical protein
MAEPLVPQPRARGVEMTTEKLKRHKPSGIDQIPAELIKAGARTFRFEIHELINYIWNKKELPEEWKESIIVPIYKKGDKTVCSNYRGISLLLNTYVMLPNIVLLNLTSYAEKSLGIIIVDFDATGLQIIHSAFVKYLWKNGNKMKQCVSYLWISRKKEIFMVFSLSLVSP